MNLNLIMDEIIDFGLNYIFMNNIDNDIVLGMIKEIYNVHLRHKWMAIFNITSKDLQKYQFLSLQDISKEGINNPWFIILSYALLEIFKNRLTIYKISCDTLLGITTIFKYLGKTQKEIIRYITDNINNCKMSVIGEFREIFSSYIDETNRYDFGNGNIFFKFKNSYINLKDFHGGKISAGLLR